MNVKLLRAEWRAVRKASLRLMQNSLSMVGLLSIGVATVVATHPEYAHAVGRWIVPGSSEPTAAPLTPVETAAAAAGPLVDAIVHPSGEAGRLLGLTVPKDALDARDEAPALAVVKTPVSLVVDRSPAGREKREVTTYLSKKYRVNSDAVAMLVEAAYLTGKDLGLDPLLLLSVMGVESGFNPFAESTAGASGLMQLMAKVHRDKLADFGGPNIALNPIVNLRVGAVVLKDCIRRGGSIADGLRLYVGSGTSDDSGYGARVLQEKDKLAQAVRGTVRVQPRATPRIEAIPAQADEILPHRNETPPPDEKVEPKLDARRADPGVDRPEGRVASL